MPSPFDPISPSTSKANPDGQLQTTRDPLKLAAARTRLRQAWAATAAQGAEGDAQGRTAYGAVTEAVQSLLQGLTDESGLVLDPDADSFYTVNGLFMVLPRLLEDLGQAWGWASYGVAKGGLDSPEQYRKVAVWNARAGVGLDDLKASFEKAQQVSPSLAPALDLKGLERVRKFQQNADPTELIKAAATPEEVFKDGHAALQATMAVCDRALPALDALLTARLTALERSRNIKAGLALACLFLASYLFVCFRLVLEDGFAEVSRHMRALADGDLTQMPLPHGCDETADLLHGLANTQQALVEIVGEVRGATNGIAIASEQIARGSSELSGRAEQTAAQLQAAASSVEQIHIHVAGNARQTEEASQLARRNAERAGEGGTLVDDVVRTMSRMQEASRRIGDINSTIDAIAFQTNILALNAAVEAARAGEQGRGFAVVASEVRSLAQRSATAAREIKGLISSNTELTGQGAAAVQRAGGTMGELVAQAEQIRTLLDAVSQASIAQTSGVDDVAHSVQGLDGMTQQNTALAEETAAASEALRNQAQALIDCVVRFKLPS
jgi:methyl-accepting chemotaxis protein